MPTEAQVEAAARALCRHDGENPDMICPDGTPSRPKEDPLWIAGGYASAARAALTAAEAVVSEENKNLAVVYENDTGPNDEGFSEWWEVRDGDNRIGRFDTESDATAYMLALARLSAGQAVPEPWGWACWWSDNKLPDVMINHNEDQRREAARRTEHPEWRVVPLYTAPPALPVQAVPDEAAIRADERERLAKVLSAQASVHRGRAAEAGREETSASGLIEAYQTGIARGYEFAADAMIAAAPKPEDKA